MTGYLVRFIIWGAYLLLSYFGTMALGKLTGVRTNFAKPGYNEVADGLLAPLLLMQLGYPDGIAAYAVEDNRLGLRQIGSIGAKVALVVWILYRSWDGKLLVFWLYFFLFVVGIMKSALWVWALQFVNDEKSSIDMLEVGAEDMSKEISIQQVFKVIPDDKDFESAKHIMKAYYQFQFLKLQLGKWPCQPLLISPEPIPITSYPPDHTFTTIEIELNFMFDMLFTKAAILYTKLGFIGLFISFFCSVSALWVFAVIFRYTFMIDMYVTYTCAMLMAVISVELYQITVLPFSDWVVVKMSMNLDVRLVRRLLPFLADWCMKQKRWSRSIGQLNLLDHSFLYKKWWKPITVVLDWFIRSEIFRMHMLHSRQAIPSSLIALVVQNMAEIEKKRLLQPFTERGKWTLETHGIQEKQGLSESIAKKFDQSIIIWHIATESLLLLEKEQSDPCGGSKLLSDYMMYLLALHPYVLSLTPAASITLEHTCCTLRHFLRDQDCREAISILLSTNGDVTTPRGCSDMTGLTANWHVLLEVKKLVLDLRTMDNKWEIISSIWVEMLCYAAYNCPVHHHAKLLRKGGELITHVWLLLVHRTDRFHLSID
ncbi:hypothetical protein BT93_F2389 [Corymbia citriodora subsp. variegata]|nr:hypothetical protein BT93_F2389 [Corymbia citriodora subsp. variegata]